MNISHVPDSFILWFLVPQSSNDPLEVDRLGHYHAALFKVMFEGERRVSGGHLNEDT